MIRRRVVILIGLPGSGKSTYLEKLGVVPLSSDVIRLWLADDATDQGIHSYVFSTLRRMLHQRLEIGRPVSYVDATNLTPRERRPYIRIAEWHGADAEALFFEVPPEVCMERNRRRHRVVPPEAMERMAAKLVPPSPDEGFARITVIRA